MVLVNYLVLYFYNQALSYIEIVVLDIFHTVDKVEQEDEEIVEAVQKGVKSRAYDRGRYSPKREIGVHHFHLLLQKYYK